MIPWERKFISRIQNYKIQEKQLKDESGNIKNFSPQRVGRKGKRLARAQIYIQT